MSRPKLLPGTFTETLALKQVGDGKWEALHPPQRMGNTANIAYGGFAIAVAAQAACKTVQQGYHLYSIVGNFLGPALIDRPLRASTQILRNTRTFNTVQVQVSQIVANKTGQQEDRACLVALADFQVQEPGNVLEFSAPPRQKYSHYLHLSDYDGHTANMLKEGKITKEIADFYHASFGISREIWETRPCPEGIFAQTINGISKATQTTQEHLSITEKSTAEWVRARDPLPTETDQVTALAYLMDGALSFAPLAFNHMYLDDTAACSSLEFALRVFSNAFDLGAWHLRELVTHVAAEGRSYSEGRIWDEGGRCVGSMTQQSIMRAKQEGSVKGML